MILLRLAVSDEPELAQQSQEVSAGDWVVIGAAVVLGLSVVLNIVILPSIIQMKGCELVQLVSAMPSAPMV